MATSPYKGNYSNYHDEIFEYNIDDYTHICWNPKVGLCGIRRLLFTVGLWYNIEYGGKAGAPEGRYCYHTMAEAVAAFNEWDGEGDPPGDWIKHKGSRGEWFHPDSTDPYRD